MTVPLSLSEPGQPLSPGGLDFELKMALDCVAPFCKYYLRHLRKRDRANLPLSTAPEKHSPTSIASASRPSTNTDIDEQPLPEFDSDSDSDTDYVSETTNFPPLVDKHDMGFAEQTKCLTRDGNKIVADEHTSSVVTLPIAQATWTIYLNQRHQTRHGIWSLFTPSYTAGGTKGSSESNVVLEFRWTPQTKRWFGQQIDIFNTDTGNDLKQCLDGIDEFHASGSPPTMTRDGSRLQTTTSEGSPVHSGKLIHIRMQNEDASRFKDIIDMQWGCILITALSGAAGSPELLSNKDSDDKVMQWIQNQARFVEEHGFQPPEIE
ncbi:hypothetical protein DER46DRAFT_676198 [Fusarium sp. MPI-SDFR-AT-0072]|nr:hypothetical protein DER46DRAFT_676198 [Fusarium sp. MPI-SDFR-AT-0072]